jgi:alcohol dehydrogenase/propanol-preferring alcohol dehydrogenase
VNSWAVVEHGQALQPIERPSREPVGTEVLIDVTHAGVCHSDLHFWKGYYDMGGGKLMRLADRGVTLPRSPGHEVVGRVGKIAPKRRASSQVSCASSTHGWAADNVRYAATVRTTCA